MRLLPCAGWSVAQGMRGLHSRSRRSREGGGASRPRRDGRPVRSRGTHTRAGRLRARRARRREADAARPPYVRDGKCTDAWARDAGAPVARRCAPGARRDGVGERDGNLVGGRKTARDTLTSRGARGSLEDVRNVTASFRDCDAMETFLEKRAFGEELREEFCG